MSKFLIVGNHHYRNEKNDSLFRKFSVSFFYIFFMYGIGFCLNYILLSYFKVKLYGDYQLADYLIISLSTILFMGKQNVLKRFLFKYFPKDLYHLASFIRWHTTFSFRCFLIFYALFFLFAICFLILDELNIMSLADIHIVYWAVAAAPLANTWYVFCIYLLTFGYPRLYVFFIQGLPNVILFLLAATFMLLQPAPTDYDVLIYVSGTQFLLLITIFCFFYYCLKDVITKVFSIDHDLSVLPEWTDHRSQSLLIDLYSILPLTIILFILEFFSTTEITGHISLCFTIASIFQLMHNTIGPLTFKNLNDMIVQEDSLSISEKRAKLQPIKYINRIMMALSVCFLTIVYFFGSDILSLFSMDSDMMYYLLVEISLLTYIQSMYYPSLNFALVSAGLSRFTGNVELFMYLALAILGSLVVVIYDFWFLIHLYFALIIIQILMCHFKFKKKMGFSPLCLL